MFISPVGLHRYFNMQCRPPQTHVYRIGGKKPTLLSSFLNKKYILCDITAVY